MERFASGALAANVSMALDYLIHRCNFPDKLHRQSVAHITFSLRALKDALDQNPRALASFGYPAEFNASMWKLWHGQDEGGAGKALGMGSPAISFIRANAFETRSEYSNTRRLLALPNNTMGNSTSRLLQEARRHFPTAATLPTTSYPVGTTHEVAIESPDGNTTRYRSLIHMIARVPGNARLCGLPDCLERLAYIAESNVYTDPYIAAFGTPREMPEVVAPLFGEMLDLDAWVEGLSRFHNTEVETSCRPTHLTIAVRHEDVELCDALQTKLRRLGVPHTPLAGHFMNASL